MFGFVCFYFVHIEMCDFFMRAEKGHCFIEVVTITGCDDINNVQKIIKR